ncbi:sensor histidine kinase [Clostridium neuense]|uniref:histidine kinase n=1 Tax=Clostridium neuense TaxID=1728934 RepID=A0ABW8TKL3_9CLOT
MQSIRRRLSIITIACSIVAIILCALFVNLAVNNTFNKYMSDIQEQRNNRIVQYFEQIYKKDKRWQSTSGEEIMHEAYMGNYCLTLLDANKKVIWGMNPSTIKQNMNGTMMKSQSTGVYMSSTFPIKDNGKIVGYVTIGQYSPIILSKQDVDFKLAINKNIVISVIVTALSAIIISIMLSKQFSAPIKAVADTSVELSKGNYSASSDVKSDIVELNNLIESINTLGAKLKKQDELRRRLVSDISHEIRTPLNVLQNNLEAMLDGVFPVDENRLNYLNSEVIRFGKLLDNLSELNGFEDEKVQLKMKVILIDEIVKAVCDEFYIELKNKNIKLNLDIEKGKKFNIMGDYNKLKEVFINIISNAVKFTNNNGQIWIKLYKSEGKVLVKIRDNGIGIKEEDLPNIFERLYRGDKSRHKIQGNGIGLTIVKRILSLHSADIGVSSVEGKGTEFTISFREVII